MARAIDLMGIGVNAEEANRDGDIGPQYYTSATATITSVQSTTSIIGGPNGATIIEFNASSAAAVTFHPNTEIDRTYTLYNSGGTTMTIYTPVSTSGSWQTGSATTSMTIGSGKTAFITRLGGVPFPTGSVIADRWIYTLSA
jgi:hypothetical protein